MKIVRYLDNAGVARQGSLRPDGEIVAAEGDLATGFREMGAAADVAKRLAPVVPTAVFCIGLNYRRHADEGGQAYPEHPVLFMKSPEALQNPDGPIVLPRAMRSGKVDYECELAVVIGKRCKNVRPDDALDYVAGYTCANDVSARDWQSEWGGGQWCRGKTFDTFLPLGPVLVTPDEIPDPNALGLRTILSGETRQDWNTSDMIFNVRQLIAFLSGSTTLPVGAVILTGTPHGVGAAAKPPRWLEPGDEITVEIDGIGRLTNPVVEETF
jgi:2-keto-4-pentenoate hydratase/2-oxohepta-3-ene-1,7-dioic acid hydratase in catechol pathway